jgi:hypothetical protein
MHYCNLVIVKRKGRDVSEPFDLEAAVAQAMGPHEDQGGFWDWYQIGGRWTGTFDGYDPDTDPNNILICDLCLGTGKRKDMDVANGCNGCSGTGKMVTWPTQWGLHPGDIIPVDHLTEDHLSKKFYRIVTPHGCYQEERYEPWAEEKFAKLSMPTLKWLLEEFAGDEPQYEKGAEYIAVIVDNHD